MLVKLKVHAASKRQSIVRKAADAYEVWVRAPARDGLANREALDALAKAMGRRAKDLVIVKGATSPSKIVKVYGD